MGTCDLLIVHPGAAHGIYGKLGDEITAVEPPLWARIIAAYVRDRGHRVGIMDAEAMRFDPSVVADLVEIAEPRLVCIAVYGHQPSASTQQMVGASAIAREIAARNAERRSASIPVIMVGGHVAALPELTMAQEPIQFACDGEGPITVERLLAAIKSGGPVDDVPGLLWLDRDTVVRNPPPPLLEIGDLHGDAWDLLPMGRYRAHNWHAFGQLDRKPYASIHTSLGCPYRCSFCCINAPFGTNRYRMRDPEDVVDEMFMLRDEYGVKNFKIVDEMFVLNEAHYTSIADMLARSGHGEDLNIWAYARVDTIKPRTLELLRRAGFRWLALGIESGSEHVRDGAQKRLSAVDIYNVVASVREAGINVIANYIFGLPDDDLRSMSDTLALAITLNTEFANFYVAMAYPGSKLYEQAVAEGWALPETWRGYSQHNDDCRPIDTKHVTAAEVLRFRDAAFKTYFSRPRYIEMIERRFGPEAVDQVRAMLRYDLPRKLLQEPADHADGQREWTFTG